MAFPSVHNVVRIRVHDFVLRLDNACWTLFLGRLITFIFISFLLAICIFFGLLFLCLCIQMILSGLVDVFLELGLSLIHIHIVQKRIASFDLDCHQLRFAAMTFALDVLHDFVISGNFLLVLRQNFIDTINCCIGDEFLELSLHDKVTHISVEHNIISHDYTLFVILIVLSLTNTVR